MDQAGVAGDPGKAAPGRAGPVFLDGLDAMSGKGDAIASGHGRLTTKQKGAGRRPGEGVRHLGADEKARDCGGRL
jgi:hypothetical protein